MSFRYIDCTSQNESYRFCQSDPSYFLMRFSKYCPNQTEFRGINQIFESMPRRIKNNVGHSQKRKGFGVEVPAILKEREEKMRIKGYALW